MNDVSPVKPYIPAETELRDFTLRAVLSGIIFGAIFGSANAYLGLRVGLTISTSIPLAVISVAWFKLLEIFLRKSNILEYNICQTAAAAASSCASGIIFTIPALFMWNMPPTWLQMSMLAMLGGVLGILFMIPLRPFLIVKEHATLPYPEGTAAGQVLIASDAGGSRAQLVFVGLGIGAVYKGLQAFGKVWADIVNFKIPLLKKGVLGLEPTPALLSVGFILGYRISAIMVAGGLLSSLALIPIIAHFGELLPSPLFPETVKTIGQMSAGEIWSRYIRYIGAGAVALAGIITVIKNLPTMFASLKQGLRGLTAEGRVALAEVRTDRSLSFKALLFGAAIVILVAALTPGLLGTGAPLPLRLAGAAALTVFAFLFVTVSARIVGLVGVSSNPTSGMTIVTLLLTSLFFLAMGWTDTLAKATILTIGTIVCVAASMGGDMAQELKCGQLIGATPRKQQIAELIGACTAAFAVAGSVYLLGQGLTFGSADIPAPQATLMKTVVEGVLQANLPWGLVLAGAALALAAFLLGIPPLPFAVGIYLPLSTMTPVFVGGCLRAIVEWCAERKKEDPSARRDRGILLSSGLIAGEGLMGVALGAFAYIMKRKPAGLALPYGEEVSEILSLLLFAGLGYFLFAVARGKKRA